MKVKIEFSTDDAALADCPLNGTKCVLESALAHLLKMLKSNGGKFVEMDRKLVDINGNSIGTVRVTK